MKRAVFLVSIFMILALAACTGAGPSSAATSAVGTVVSEATSVAPTLNAGASTVVSEATSAAPTVNALGSTAVSMATSAAPTVNAVGTSVAPQTGSTTVTTGVPQTGAATTAAPVGTVPAGTQAATAAAPTPAPTSVAPTMTQLTGLMAYRLADTSGKVLGTISDFIVNMCTDRIVYIVMTPDPDTKVTSTVLIPYEAVKFQTVGKEDFMVVNLDASKLSSAPVFDQAKASLTNPDWVTSTNAFWSNSAPLSQPVDCSSRANISSLVAGTAQATNQVSGPASTAGTSVAGTTVPAATMGASVSGTALPAATTGATGMTGGTYNLAYARSINYTHIEDSTGTILGAVNSILVRPEDGTLVYFILQTFKEAGLTQAYIAIPAPAVSLKNAAGTSSGTTGTAAAPASTASATGGASTPESQPLVLQVPMSALQNAPAFDIMQNITKSGWDQSTIQFWTTLLPTAQP